MGSKTIFPESWNFKDINSAANKIISNSSNSIDGITFYGHYTKNGSRVKIKVVVRDRKIQTCHPTWIQ